MSSDKGTGAAAAPRPTTAAEGRVGRAGGRRLKSIVRGHGLPPAAGEEAVEEEEEDCDEAFVREESEADEGRLGGPPPPPSWGASGTAGASGRSSDGRSSTGKTWRSKLETLKYPGRDPCAAEPTGVSSLAGAGGGGGYATAAHALRWELEQELNWCRKEWGLYEKDGKRRDMEALMADVLQHVGRKVLINLQR